MKTELHEQLGKAVYEVERRHQIQTEAWENLPKMSRKMYGDLGEAAVSSFVGTIKPMLNEEQRKQLMEVIDICSKGKIMQLDNINNNDLPRLKTQELIDLYHHRKDDADAVWGLIMMRATIYERVMQENSSLLMLLRDCAKLLDTGEDTEHVQERIQEFLVEHEEE